MTDQAPRGPLPEVLARLAADGSVPSPAPVRNPRWRWAGVFLCVVTAGAVVAAVVVAGAP